MNELPTPSPMIWRCPKCGFEARGLANQQIVINLPGLTGHYCLVCYLRLIAHNVPKMERADEKIEGTTDA
jgi:hypothetical protein